jgi:hypothetical protein
MIYDSLLKLKDFNVTIGLVCLKGDSKVTQQIFQNQGGGFTSYSEITIDGKKEYSHYQRANH